MPQIFTVLHIDDDPAARLLLREFAEDAGRALAGEVHIRWLDSGFLEEAVAQLRGLTPDTILLDNRLNGEQGLELLPKIRRVWNCPVWIVTGLPDASLHERCQNEGAAGLIAKDEIMQTAEQLRVFFATRCGLPGRR